MMQLMVDDLNAWWAHLSALDLESEFGMAAPHAPEMQPWGLRIAYIVDPAGVVRTGAIGFRLDAGYWIQRKTGSMIY
jgi:hypothetical protein